MTRLIESGRVKLVLNMAQVPYIDSAGISQLLRTFVTAGNRGGRMRLLHLTNRVVWELLNITRLLTVFEPFESEEEARASFAKAPGNA